ncbi:MAG: HIT family protein [Clostridia bacterium]|nr:HIT family protein [Clostridia bacterium]
MANDCIFCKIIKGEIPSNKVYEDEFTYAFLDLTNDGLGHVLVIPKKHCVNVLDCDSQTLAYVMDTVKLISNHLVDNCGFDGVNILNASGAGAEQSVFHLHFHILPRKKDDGFKTFPQLPENPMSKEDVLKLFRIER